MSTYAIRLDYTATPLIKMRAIFVSSLVSWLIVVLVVVIVAFAKSDGISGDREDLAIYKSGNGTGYLLLSSQHNSTINVYRREGDGGDPHKHSEEIPQMETGSPR